MSSSSLSIICYKNGLSYVNIPVKLEDVKYKEENKVRVENFSPVTFVCSTFTFSVANVVAKKPVKLKRQGLDIFLPMFLTDQLFLRLRMETTMMSRSSPSKKPSQKINTLH